MPENGLKVDIELVNFDPLAEPKAGRALDTRINVWLPAAVPAPEPAAAGRAWGGCEEG
jgi:hypothetical protein